LRTQYNYLAYKTFTQDFFTQTVDNFYNKKRFLKISFEESFFIICIWSGSWRNSNICAYV